MAKLVIALLLIGAASFILTLATQVSVFLVRRRRRPGAPEFPISVLKPLKGDDPELYENLASFARQNYPCFELVLGCEDPLDPALRVAFRLARDFPDVAIKVVSGGRQIGQNPKVNNLSHIARSARYEHFLISDADVRVGSGYLRAVAAEMLDERVGLVSNVIAASSAGSAAARVESLHVNTFIARSVCGAEILAGKECVIGKSMLFRRSELDRLGGLAAAKDVLAEDYAIANLFSSAGYRVALSPYAVRTMNAPRPARDLFARHVRWSQMRRHLIPHLYWGEALMMPTLWFVAVLVVLCLYPGGIEWARPGAALSVAALAVLGIADVLLVHDLTGQPLDPRWALFGPLRDAAAFVAWIEGAFRRTVVWRGNVFTIGTGSTLTPHHAPVADGSHDAEAGVASLEA